MSVQTVINVTCNGENCKHTRALDANHWMVGVVINKVIYITTSRKDLPAIWHENSTRVLDDEINDFCGQECLVKWISRQLMAMRAIIDDEKIYEAPKREVGTPEKKFQAEEE